MADDAHIEVHQLAAQILASLDAEEAQATTVPDHDDEQCWYVHDDDGSLTIRRTGDNPQVVATIAGYMPPQVAHHIARHDPWRTRTSTEALRALVRDAVRVTDIGMDEVAAAIAPLLRHLVDADRVPVALWPSGRRPTADEAATMDGPPYDD